MFQGNKLVLATFSRFFSDIFSKTSSNENLTLYLKGIKYKQLITLMSFMYSGSIEIPEREVQAVLSAAQVLRLDGFYQDEINIADVGSQTNKVGKNNTDRIAGEERPDEASQQQQTTHVSRIQTTEYFVNNEQMETRIKEERSKKKSSEKKTLRDIAEKENLSNSFDITEETCDVSIKDRARFSCSECGSSYASPGALMNHRRGKHEGRVFRCDRGDCGFSSDQAGNLKTHVIKKH